MEERIDKDFVPYTTALELRALGWHLDSPVGYYSERMVTFPIDKHGICGTTNVGDFCTDDHVDFLVALHGDEFTYTYAPLYQQVFRWFREKYGIKHIINPSRTSSNKQYYFNIFIDKDGEEIGDWQDDYNNILEESFQDVEGDHVNDEIHDKLILERKFAFLSYEEAELECIRKMIEIVKQQKQ